ncbi:MAG: T9SS type A sorting domain-containing protein [Chitinophagales bacterium]|nr:T9SS type A sorting domain-containing protein [Chitinophagales bacterium]
MNRLFYLPFCLLVLSAMALILYADRWLESSAETNEAGEFGRRESGKEANEDFLLIRAYPDAYIDPAAFGAVVNKALAAAHNAVREEESWIVEGPGNIGGRINCSAIDPVNPNTMFVGNASGGIFKTTDGGLNWTPVFDAQPYLAIGAITIDPSDHQTVWAGTGDLNISGYPFIGDGIYKSIDGGLTWTHMGLTAQCIVAKIIVDPTNSAIIYAAAMGIPFFESADRGLYKSTDGGLTWNQVLFVDEDAGIIDVVMSPADPLTLYAASWNRIRNNQSTVVYGPDAHIYKSTNGGNTWSVLTNGLPAFNTCRIGLAISQQNPSKLYAMIVDTTLVLQGVYKTVNAGSSWSNVTGNFDNGVFGTQGWYFGKIYVNPANDNQIYVPGVDLQKSSDGGNNWSTATPPWWTYEVHADGHYMDFVNENTFYYCTDGGMYKTTDNCATWSDAEDIPNTQFYHVAYNPFQADQVFGGAQDNGTTGGSALGINGWERIYGGDGFKPVYDPVNSNLFYVETQNGGLAYTNNGGLSFDDFTNGIDWNDRVSWDMPYIISPVNHTVFYCGTYRVYKRNGAPNGSWSPVSPDLTDGVVYGDRFHVITTIAQSSLNENFLYAGTSDGNVWYSQDGSNWVNVTSGLPERYVTSIFASPGDTTGVYVTHSGYKNNDFIPHIHKSVNNGQNWTDISGDLPQWAINDVWVMPGNEATIFVATDGGVYYTENGGVNWNRLGNNMPLIAVYDIEFNPVSNRLIAGTFARSIWTIDISKLTGIQAPAPANNQVAVYPNPVTDYLTLDLNNSLVSSIVIYNTKGEVVFSRENIHPRPKPEIPVVDLPAGIYYFQLKGQDQAYSGKFVKM